MGAVIVVGVLSLVAIAGAAVLGPRIRVAAPLILVALGIVPWIPDARIDPEWVLAGCRRCCTRRRCRCHR